MDVSSNEFLGSAPAMVRVLNSKACGGQKIANIYDYTYALELLKIGQPAKVIYMRNGEKRETMLTPSARK